MAHLEISAAVRMPSNMTKIHHSKSHMNRNSLHFNSHFPGEPGLAGFTEAKDDGSGSDNRCCKL